MRIRSLLSAFALVCAAASPAAAQFTVTAPITPGTGTNAVKAANDFATRAFQDPWDMSQRTDVGWWLFGTDNAVSTVNWTNPTFSNGIFSGTVGASAGLFLLESGLHETTTDPATPIGKTGKQYPIDATTYTHLVYRMSSSTGFQVPGDSTATVSQFVWSKKTIYDDQTLGFQQNVTTAGLIRDWAFYDINLPALNLGLANNPWSGSIGAFQFLPNLVSGSAIQIDWIRLVQDDNSLYRTITWTGAGQVDIYLDNDNNPANGTLGRIAIKKTGGSYSLFVGALEPGDYYVAVAASSTNVVTPSTSAYSPGFYRVNAIPTLTFTTPSDEGSADDFATAKLGNPWDFRSMNDIDYRAQIQNEAITTLDLVTEAGVSLPSQTVYLASSTPATPASGNVGDPFLFPLFWDYRGKVTRIDPTRYRILTVDMGIPNLARSLPGGSIGRVVWRAVNEPVRDANNVGIQTVGQAWVVNHKLGENTLSHVTVDLNKIPIVPSSAAQTTWGSVTAAAGIDAFRFDSHEFSAPTLFFMKKIKIASLERTASNLLTFRWNYSKASGTVDLYRELASASTHSFAGVKLNGSSINAATGSYTWDTTGVPDGEYAIYAIFTDGTNSNQVYAPTPIVVDANNVAVPQIVLNRSTLIFGALGPIRTAAQTVRLTFSGTGLQCWTATTNHPGVVVSPTSGNGAANLQVSIPGTFAGGTTNALITIATCQQPLTNSRAIAVTVNAMNSSSGPTGALDTPADGQAVVGSVGVTGWAVDDIGVGSVTICRDAVAGEAAPPNGACGGNARIFIGNATFIDDARPDIETASSTSPANYRAGWGYLMLTNFLPSQGNGTFKIYAYAFDVDSHVALIGSKTIVGQNAAATKPFGAIDTPGQGEVVCGGAYANFGWALTRPLATIPANSSTITVYIDGVARSNPSPLAARSDIQTLFPTGYNDPSHSVGAYVFDTTQYANGVHTIFWVVTDSVGQSDGIGSRFFTISNPCSGS